MLTRWLEETGIVDRFKQAAYEGKPPKSRIVLGAGQLVLQRGGVIRGIANWGTFSLPRMIYKAQAKHHTGHYFVMRYDASVDAQKAVCNTLRLDPRLTPQ